MALRIGGRATERDYVAAQFTHLRPGLWLRRVGLVLVAAIVVFGIVDFAAWPPHLGSIMVLAFLIYLALMFGLVVPANARRTFRQQKSLQTPYELEVTPDALVSRSEHGEVRTPWSHFVGWKEGDRVILLYQSDRLFQLVPKSFAPSETVLAELRGAFGKKLGRPR